MSASVIDSLRSQLTMKRLQAGLIDSLHLVLAPVVLGKGEALFRSGIFGNGAHGYQACDSRCIGKKIETSLIRLFVSIKFSD